MFFHPYKYQFIPFLSLALILAGCSTSSEIFDCEPGKGVGCRSITTVNKMIDQGHFTSAASNVSLAAPVLLPISASASQVLPQALPFSEEIVLSDKMVVQRFPEQHIRLWVAPYQDEAGNFHEASLVHSVIQTGFWHVQGNPFQDNSWGVKAKEGGHHVG